jgi:hypothetical protein
MQLIVMTLFLALAAPADPAPSPGAPAAAEKAKVTIQVLSAKAGDGSTGEGVDPRLAAKLRVSLEQMGMRKPDITSLSKPKNSSLGPGDTATAAHGSSGVEVTCKAVSDEGVTLSVSLFSEVKEGKKTVKKSSDPTTVKFTKPGQVQPFVQGDGKAVRVYVVGAVREGDGKDAGGSSDPPKDAK